MPKAICKICQGECSVFAHTAKCKRCGVLLYYPYVSDEVLGTFDEDERKSAYNEWYREASFLNHVNFTNMFRFVIDPSQSDEEYSILDYGGGGGQFALIALSHLPNCKVFITDICDHGIQSHWASINNQILFKDFPSDENKFDVIFLNDVFEHVNNPLGVIQLLASKLKKGGKIFIDTPKQFWLYPVLKFIYKPLYHKLLIGTVQRANLQIWTKKSFNHVLGEANLKIVKYKEVTEFTRRPPFYLDAMGITSPIIRFFGAVLYSNARWLLRNKIMCVCQEIS